MEGTSLVLNEAGGGFIALANAIVLAFSYYPCSALSLRQPPLSNSKIHNVLSTQKQLFCHDTNLFSCIIRTQEKRTSRSCELPISFFLNAFVCLHLRIIIVCVSPKVKFQFSIMAIGSPKSIPNHQRSPKYQESMIEHSPTAN